MNNRDRALALLNDLAERMDDDAVSTFEAVQELHGAGLLAPDLAHTVIEDADRIARLEDELHHVTQHALAQGRKLRKKQLQAQRLQQALHAGLGAHALDVDDLIRDGHLTEEDMQ